jgi:DNA replication and repair protein RecF
LIKHGSYISEQRRAFLDFFAKVQFPMPFTVEYDHSLISEARVSEYLDREIAAGHTLIGPHKDDLIVRYRFTPNQPPLPVAAYGSRGQQRLAVLWLKVSEYEFLKDKTASTPLLLLDDILSELDVDSRAKVLSLLGLGQSVITTTEDKIVAELTKTVSHIQVLSLV